MVARGKILLPFLRKNSRRMCLFSNTMTTDPNEYVLMLCVYRVGHKYNVWFGGVTVEECNAILKRENPNFYLSKESIPE
jgi:hypothetical protein